MNQNVFTGEVAAEVEIYGLPGKERVEFWFAERSGREPLKFAVKVTRRYAVEVAQTLEKGDRVGISGFWRSRRCRCPERHFFYWFEALMIEPLFPRDGQRKGWDG